MLKRDITYEDFNGEKVTETFYFNISKPELVELEVDVEGGFGQFLERIVKIEDQKQLVAEFKRIVLMAYGEKSDDGKRFMKRDDEGRPLSRFFEQSAAYPELYMELSTNEKAAAEFIKGILPKDLAAEVAKQENETPKPPSLNKPEN